MKRLPFAAALLLGLLVAGITSAFAQTPESAASLRVTTTIEPEAPRLGERVRLLVDVTHATDRVVVMTRGLERGASLELVASDPPAIAAQGAEQTTTFTFVVQPFALGPIDLGSIELQVLTEDGSMEVLEVALPALTVPSTIAPDRAALRPLKPQATITGAPPAWVQPAFYVGATGLVIVLTGAIALYARRRLGAHLEPLAIPLAATAEDEARQQLDDVRERDLLAIPDLEAFYGRLSAIIRGYLEDRFKFRATALTRRELERRMTAEGLDRWQTRLVAGLIERCDAAVYARVYPPLASADHDLTVAYEIVELARPQRTEAVPA